MECKHLGYFLWDLDPDGTSTSQLLAANHPPKRRSKWSICLRAHPMADVTTQINHLDAQKKILIALPNEPWLARNVGQWLVNGLPGKEDMF